MTDETLPDRTEVASAYLDGELDPDERASADADPETMALVEAFRTLRTTIGDVPPASMGDRATALSAALAEYDSLAPMRRLTPLSELEPRRHHGYRWLLGAAAALVVVIAAVVIVASGGSNNSKQTASEPRTSTAPVPAAPTTKAAGAPPATTVAGPAGTQAPASGGGGATADVGAPTPINSPAALRQFAESSPAFSTEVAAAGTGTTAAASPVPSGPPCVPAGDTVLGYITFLNIPAYAVLDGSNGTIKALAASDCRQLISVSP